MRPQNSFFRFSLKIPLFRKNCWIKKYSGYIQFWCKMTPDRSHSNTVEHVANKLRVEWAKPLSTLICTFRNIVLLTHFLRQRFILNYFLPSKHSSFLKKFLIIFGPYFKNSKNFSFSRKSRRKIAPGSFLSIVIFDEFVTRKRYLISRKCYPVPVLFWILV